MSAYKQYSPSLHLRIIITCLLLMWLASACHGSNDTGEDANQNGLSLLATGSIQKTGANARHLVRVPMIAIQNEDEEEPSGILIFSYMLANNQRSDSLHYYSTQSQRFLWELALPPSQNVIVPRNIAAYDRDRIYLVNTSELLGIDRQDGSVLWQAQLSSQVSYDNQDSIRVLDGRIFVLGHDLNLQAFDTDGQALWSRQLSHTYKNDAAIHIVDGNLAVMDLTLENNVRSPISLKILDARDGSLAHQMVPTCSDPQDFYPDVYSDVISPLKIDTEKQRAYFVFNGIRWSCMQAWDVAGGENIWQQETMDKINLPYFEPARSTLLGKNHLFIGTENAAKNDSAGIYSITLADGEAAWLVEDSQASFFNPLLKAGNLLITRVDYEYTSQSSILAAFDANSGEKVWEFPLDVKPTNVDDRSTDLFLTDEGLAVVQVLDNPMAIYYDLLDIEDGGRILAQVHSELKLGHWEDSRTILAGGRVYFMQSNGMYTIDLSDGSVTPLLGQN